MSTAATVSRTPAVAALPVTHLVLAALDALLSGRDVIVVALDRGCAVEIAREVCRWSKRMSIPCANVAASKDGEGNEGGNGNNNADGSVNGSWSAHRLPRVSVRGYLEPPKLKRFDNPTTVLFDASARFGRNGEWAMVSGRVRLVVTTDSGMIPAEV